VGKIRTSGRAGKVADVALWSAIIAAPLLGGSASLKALPPLAALTTIAFVFTILANRHAGRSLHVQLWWLAFAALTLLGIVQVVPLPIGLLEILSPRAAELRTFITAEVTMAPVAYEPSESLRSALKLAMCGMLGLVAYERVRARKRIEFVSTPMIAGAVATVIFASAHAVLGRAQLFGFIDMLYPASSLSTTFVNENHAAGFMVLTGMTALGMTVAPKGAQLRLVFAAAAALTMVMLVVLGSRGGMVAIFVSFIMFAGLRYREQRAIAESEAAKRPGAPRGRGRRHRRKQVGVWVPVGAAVLVGLIAIAATWFQPQLAEALTDRRDPLALQSKIAAMQDAWPLIWDHGFTGIGRGAYVSVYPGYKTSPIQLTFTHPENLVIQLLAEWGLLVGGLALIGLIGAIAVRLGRGKGPVVQGMMCGVAGVVLQNFVDFSLELPGLALPASAALGACAVGTVKARRVKLRAPARMVAAVAAPVALVIILLIGAFTTPDLREDLTSLEATIATYIDGDGREDALPGTLNTHERMAARHPANHVVAARIAYLAEVGSPTEVRDALRWANRTLYLAPTYADGHLAAGRLLIRGGIRKQGFVALREAWALASASRIDAFISETVSLARSPEELILAVPRKDVLQDSLHEAHVIRALRALVKRNRKDWGVALVRKLPPPEEVAEDKLLQAAVAAVGVGELDVAERLIARCRHQGSNVEAAALLLIKVYNRRGDRQRVQEVIAEMLQRNDIDPTPFLRARVNVEIAGGQIALARRTLAELELRVSPTQRHQVDLARTRSRIETKDGNFATALRAISEAVRLSPGDADIRMARARLLERLGRTREAQRDAEMALASVPKHKAARSMMARLRTESSSASAH